jgi:DNA-directed RNA polymerase specialized sigma24 family protein
MSTPRALRAALLEASRRYSRVPHEAEDLAHDLIVSALRRGCPLDGEAVVRSASGAARRHGAFLARSAGRRRAREALSAGPELADLTPRPEAEAEADDGGTSLSVLTPTLRTTLYLLVAGLEKAELRVALGLSDAALRKRFQALRARAPLARPALPVRPRTPAHVRLRQSQVGLLPQLAGARPGDGRVLATSDPDGHGIIFTEALTDRPRTATTGAPAPHELAKPERTLTKGNPC